MAAGQAGRLLFVEHLGKLLQAVRQPLLLHEAILLPAARVLAACARGNDGEALSPAEEVAFALFLKQLCMRFADDPSLLVLFFGPHPAVAPPIVVVESGGSGDGGPADDGGDSSSVAAGPAAAPALVPAAALAAATVAWDFPVLTALIEGMHRPGDAGRHARDALLLVLALARDRADLAVHLVRRTGFCQALTGGLSALYSALPAALPCVVETACRGGGFGRRGPPWGALAHACRRLSWARACVCVCLRSLGFLRGFLPASVATVWKTGLLTPDLGPFTGRRGGGAQQRVAAYARRRRAAPAFAW